MIRDRTTRDRSFPYWALPFLLAALATRRFSVAIAPLVAFAVLVVVDTLATRSAARRMRLRVVGSGAAPDTVAIGDRIEFVQTFPSLDPRIGGGDHRAVSFVPTRAGVVTGSIVDVRVSAMGLVDRVRSVDAGFVRPLFVAPDIIPPKNSQASIPDDLTTSRRYEWGDRPSRINWAATARTGEMMVRSQGVDHDGLTIVVDLSRLVSLDDPAVVDDHLGRSAGLVIDAMESGREVMLVTNELSDAEIADLMAGDEPGPHPGRLVERSVIDRSDVLLRLARSVPGRPIEGADDAIRVPVGVAT